MTLTLGRLLPLVPGLPLLGVAILVLGGRRLPDRVAAWLATALVGLSFALTAGIGLELRSLGISDWTMRRNLWSWIDAGTELVAVPVTRAPLDPGATVTGDDVGRAWVAAADERLLPLLPELWDPAAVVGQSVGAVGLPAGAALARGNVPPAGPDAFAVADPERQRRLSVAAELQLDGLSLAMALVVTGVGFLIHVFAVGYMAGDPGVRRFFAYMNLFVFSMLTLVLGANFLVLFVGWELVGLCSYLLIGFWFRDPANADAGRKAFIVNRVGDFAFLVALMLIWVTFGSLDYESVLVATTAERLLPVGGVLALAITGLLLVGATGKSAQIPLYVWLPDAMAGPTPVSALIHAATMVTAGVYMIVRAHVLFEQAPAVLAVVAAVGAITALLAAAIAVVQVDIKRLLAYSTISQLGYMFLAVGAGAYVAGIFHLMTHAFFKALLFLGAGSLMHALEHGFERAGDHPADEDGVPAHQDLRRMGGLLGRVPVTGWTFAVGGLALAGLFPLAGFWSKDEILFETLAAGGGLWTALGVVALVTAFLTALYAGRGLLMALAGAPRSAGAEGAAESPRSMTGPLVALALLSVVGGLPGVVLGGRESVLATLLAPVVGAHHAEGGPDKLVLALVATALSLAGLGLAWAAYGRRRILDPARVAARLPWAYRLAWRKLYVDELYLALFVRPFRAAADFLWQVVDDGLVDGTVNAAGRAAVAAGQGVRRAQTGNVRQYALSMLVGVLAIALYLLLWAR